MTQLDTIQTSIYKTRHNTDRHLEYGIEFLPTVLLRIYSSANLDVIFLLLVSIVHSFLFKWCCNLFLSGNSLRVGKFPPSDDIYTNYILPADKRPSFVRKLPHEIWCRHHLVILCCCTHQVQVNTQRKHFYSICIYICNGGSVLY
jgi:hypothetical protein